MKTTSDLKLFLDALYQEYNSIDYLGSDPLQFVHLYRDPVDQEVIAVLSALLAYGRASQVCVSVRQVIDRVGLLVNQPKDLIPFLQSSSRKGTNRKELRKVLKGFAHRFNVGRDIALLLEMVSKSIVDHGSLKNHLASFQEKNVPTIEPAIHGVVSDWKKAAGQPRQSSFHFLLTSPKDGSVCKRWCMLFRWLVRRDDLDIGLWADSFRTSQLIMPMDTHLIKISRALGLTNRKTMNWKAALEVTEAFKKACPDDPTKYDFALSRLGILDQYQKFDLSNLQRLH